jgi:hypothetical protein
MQDVDESESKAPVIVGFLGVALSVLGMADLPLPLELACFLGASVCFPVSFVYQTGLPHWSRWLLSVLADSFLVYAAWGAIHSR